MPCFRYIRCDSGWKIGLVFTIDICLVALLAAYSNRLMRLTTELIFVHLLRHKHLKYTFKNQIA